MNYESCKNCNKRHLYCHSECPEYIQFKKQSQEEKNEIKKKKSKESIFGSYYKAKFKK